MPKFFPWKPCATKASSRKPYATKASSRKVPSIFGSKHSVHFVDRQEESDTFGGSRYRITSDELIGVVKSDMCTRFLSDVGVLVRDKCGVDWETWRATPEEMKMHLINESAACAKLFVK
ncbi:hypothetical protein DVH24_009884 [Malus domestica]|uniref:Uncharacterized protein n=1 Tax=Malus domestica TaxID=3750 RepID=A0A498JNN9_MALDO|nr:hypothetical protein DVH24_009884 [Malus domestica]